MSNVKVTARYDSSSIAEAVRDVKSYEFRKTNAIGSEIKSGLRRISRKARARAPRGPTGNLKKRIGMRFFKDDSKGYVQTRGPHSHLIEFGVSAYTVKAEKGKVLRITDYNLGLTRFVSISKKGIHIPARKPQPFLFNSAEEEIPGIEEKLKEVLKRV